MYLHGFFFPNKVHLMVSHLSMVCVCFPNIQGGKVQKLHTIIRKLLALDFRMKYIYVQFSLAFLNLKYLFLFKVVLFLPLVFLLSFSLFLSINQLTGKEDKRHTLSILEIWAVAILNVYLYFHYRSNTDLKYVLWIYAGSIVMVKRHLEMSVI